jgi:hypothetical protein
MRRTPLLSTFIKQHLNLKLDELIRAIAKHPEFDEISIFRVDRSDNEMVLYTLIHAGYVDCVKLLIYRGISLKCKHGSLVASAMRNGDVDMCKLLLASGVQADFSCRQIQGSCVRSARCREMCDLVLAHGADINTQTAGEGYTIMHSICYWAIFHDESISELYHTLIAHGARLDIKDFDGKTPLATARELERVPLYNLMFETMRSNEIANSKALFYVFLCSISSISVFKQQQQSNTTTTTTMPLDVLELIARHLVQFANENVK